MGKMRISWIEMSLRVELRARMFEGIQCGALG
jgi:hypothetical protein